MAAGFTSGEKKIADLLGEDLKQIRVNNNERAVNFERSMQYKIGILTSALMSRHKNGEEGLNLLDHAAKNENDMEAKDKFSSVFNTSLLCSL